MAAICVIRMLLLVLTALDIDAYCSHLYGNPCFQHTSVLLLVVSDSARRGTYKKLQPSIAVLVGF